MIVSHAHRFIFLKTKKTAGSSTEFALAEFCGDDDIITPASPGEEHLRGARGAQNYWLPWRRRSPLGILRAGFSRTPERHIGFYNHMPASRARKLLGPKIWSGYFKFAFERNPWDRQVSLYYWRYPDPQTRPDFETFLTDRRWLRTTKNFGIYAIGDEVAVDFVGRYDRLLPDLRTALAEVGISEEPRLPGLKTQTRAKGRDYRSYYNDQTRDIVADLYRREIDAFGFEF
jgi:hypothetical protein